MACGGNPEFYWLQVHPRDKAALNFGRGCSLKSPRCSYPVRPHYTEGFIAPALPCVRRWIEHTCIEKYLLIAMIGWSLSNASTARIDGVMPQRKAGRILLLDSRHLELERTRFGTRQFRLVAEPQAPSSLPWVSIYFRSFYHHRIIRCQIDEERRHYSMFL